MPLDAQTSLLRVLQEGEVLRIGAAHPVKVNVRIIAATHCDLLQAVENGAFRRDLYYRLNVLSLPVPPLRERREDIAGLVNGFIHKLSTRMKKIPPQVSPQAMVCLNAWHWPGNVRELENLVERMVNLCEGVLIDVDDLPREIAQAFPEQEAVPSSRLEDNERAHIIQIIESSNGNLRQAARLLGLSRTTLYNKINRWQIDLTLLRP